MVKIQLNSLFIYRSIDLDVIRRVCLGGIGAGPRVFRSMAPGYGPLPAYYTVTGTLITSETLESWMLYWSPPVSKANLEGADLGEICLVCMDHKFTVIGDRR